MDDPPQSYSSLFNDHISGISYIDFLPYGVKENFLSKPKCDRFEKLIDSANQWLSRNPQWKVVTCESVEFKDKNGQVMPTKMSYYENTKVNMSYIRGLRLWLRTVPIGQERIQKIGYRNLVPEKVSSATVFSSAKYETLDDVLQRFNTSGTSHLPGRIITIETQGMKIKSGGVIDPDRSRWTEFDGQDNRFIYIIRIFYEIGEPSREAIGMIDFVPESRSSGLFVCTEYETFSSLFERASSWCSKQRDMRICNMQTLSTKIQSGGVNPRKMSYTEHEGHVTPFVRTLRVAYTRQKHSPASIRYSCKTFVPVQLQSSSLFSISFETLQETMKKVSDWIQKNNAEVINMETAAVRLSSKGPIYSSNKSHYCDRGSRECYIFIIRAYLKGSYN